jgi:1-deoxy-D-xylulose-5-phosphate synthase
MMKTALKLPGPSAIRYPRGVGTGIARKTEPEAIPVGKAEVIKDGSDVAILGLGPMMPLAQQLAERLEREGYSAAVINPRFVKPLDIEMLAEYANRVAAFVTFEDHIKMGGFGSAVIEALGELGSDIPVVRIGWPDQFIEHGKVDDLRAKYGLTVEAAQAEVLPLLVRRHHTALVAG